MTGALSLGLDGFAGWLADTLLATSLLILLVLLVRRPVAQLCGPRLAYALWALPAARLILPPLPSPWFAGDVAPTAMNALPTMEMTTPWLFSADPVLAAASDAIMSVSRLVSAEALLAAIALLWAGGAAVAMTRLWLAHRRMLASLDDAELVEWHGSVRLYRSAAVTGPLAFGLMAPAIVLPDDERLPLTDAERALAIRHELAHHSRGDLWANAFAVLFAALHWFHPLIGRAWRAFRFDQEAACDTTVLDRSTPAEKALYARTLAKAATGRASAFASPLIGQERLKERLFMLAQPPASVLRRRTGAALAVISALGLLALTASPVSADPAVPAPPAPPAAPAVADSPQPPQPLAPLEPRASVRVITVDRSQDQADSATQAAEGAGAAIAAAREDMARHRMVIRHSRAMDGMDRTEIAALMAYAREQARAAAAEARAANGHAQSLIRVRACNDAVEAELFGSAALGEAGQPQIRLVRCVERLATPHLQVEALRRARNALASIDSRHLPAEARDSAIAELDSAIAAVEAEANRTTSD